MQELVEEEEGKEQPRSALAALKVGAQTHCSLPLTCISRTRASPDHHRLSYRHLAQHALSAPPPPPRHPSIEEVPSFALARCRLRHRPPEQPPPASHGHHRSIDGAYHRDAWLLIRGRRAWMQTRRCSKEQARACGPCGTREQLRFQWTCRACESHVGICPVLMAQMRNRRRREERGCPVCRPPEVVSCACRWVRLSRMRAWLQPQQWVMMTSSMIAC
jgi:hypothetical protein